MGRLILVLLLSPLWAEIAAANQVSSKLASQGGEALRAEQYAKAKLLCEQAIVADPADASGFACLGRSFAKSGKGKTADHYYKKALEITPTHINALTWSALRDLAIGRPDKARAKLDRLEKHCGKCELSQKLRAAYTKYKAKKNAARHKNK